MTSSEKRDLQELKRVVLGAAGRAAMDSANHAGVSLTLDEQQSLKYQQTPKYAKRTVAMDSGPSKGARFVVRRHDKRLTVGPVSALDYKHPGTPSLNCSVVDHGMVYDSADTLRKEQDAIEPDVNDPEQYPESQDDALTDDEREQLEASLQATQSDERNAGGARFTGLERLNKRRLGNKVARVS
jgi:hypothetical protein